MATAQAQQPQPCGVRADIIAQLRAKYGEQPTAFGIASNGGIVEVIRSADSWTITYTGTDGVTCLIAAGSHWEQLPPPEKGEAS